MKTIMDRAASVRREYEAELHAIEWQDVDRADQNALDRHIGSISELAEKKETMRSHDAEGLGGNPNKPEH